MKKLDNYNRCVNKLAKIVKLANEQFFDGKLPEVTVTLQESVKAYGSITTSNCWFTSDGEKQMKELNISSVYLTRPIEEVITTILHELCHLYAMENNIKDVSNNGYFHNKKFKEIAENIAKIEVQKHDKYGWTISLPTEDTIDFCISNGLTDFEISRAADWSAFIIGGDNNKSSSGDKPKIATPKPRNNSRKWVCPKCGLIMRSTRDDLRVLCMDCNEQLVRA